MQSIPLIIAAATVICLSSCGSPEHTRADEAADKGILILGNGGEPKTLDPGQTQSVGDSNLANSMFEGLVNYHPTDDSKASPGVAESWESNEDFTVWTFHLREDAKWSNGAPVTAQDFIYSWKRTLSPNFASPYASMLYFLKNASEYNEEKITDFELVGAKAPDDYTLVCTLTQPTAFFPGVLKHTTWFPVHQATVEAHGAMDSPFTEWQRPPNHVGNGPFRLKSWRINHRVEVERNPHYWDADNVELNEIWFIPADLQTEERMFRNGLIHKTYDFPAEMIDYYREHYSEFVREEVYLGSYFYRCNTTRPPLDDVRVRKALALAIDREQITVNVMRGGEQPATGFSPPIEGSYQPPDLIETNIAEAKRLLAEAGYADGLPPFELLINTSEAHKRVAEAIQRMWTENLGLDKKSIRINNQEWKVFQATTFEMNFDMARAGWIGDYVDPTTFLDMWRTGDSNNNTGWGSEDYDRLLREAALESDPAARMAILQRAETIVLEELPIIPIYWYTSFYAIDPRVKNWNPTVLDKRNYANIGFHPAETTEED